MITFDDCARNNRMTLRIYARYDTMDSSFTKTPSHAQSQSPQNRLANSNTNRNTIGMDTDLQANKTSNNVATTIMIPHTHHNVNNGPDRTPSMASRVTILPNHP